MSGNSPAQFANCRDWRGGSEKRRYATIEDIRGQLTVRRLADHGPLRRSRKPRMCRAGARPFHTILTGDKSVKRAGRVRLRLA